MSALADLRLDIPTLADVDEVHAIFSDPRLWTHLPSGRHTDRSMTVAMVRRWMDGWERDGLSTWVVRDSETGAVLGGVGCAVRDGAFWNVGYRLAAAAQGRGIATRVSAHAIARARELRPDLPIVANLLEHNAASAHVAEKLGLTLQQRAPDAGNPDPEAIRVVYSDRALIGSAADAVLR